MKSSGKAWLWALLPPLLLIPPLLWEGDRYARELADEERTRTQHTLELHAGALQRSFDRIEEKLDTLAVFVANQSAFGSNFNAGEFNAFAEGLHASSKWIRAFQVVSNGIIVHTYPLKGNEAVLGYNLLTAPEQFLGKDVLRAEQTGRVVITGPIELIQGGLGMVVRKALPHSNAAPAYLVDVVLNIAPLLAEAGIDGHGVHDVQLALRQKTGRVFFGSPAVFAQHPVVSRIALSDGEWELAACPPKGWPPWLNRPVLLFYLGGSSIILLLCALFLFRARREAQLAGMVREQTRALRNELANRQQSQEQFRLIMENLADMVAVLDLDGQRLYNSPSYDRILGDAERLAGSSSFDQVHPGDQARVRQAFLDTVRTGSGQRLQYRMMDQGGKARHIESQGSVIRDDSGKVVKVVVVSRDVTERQETQRILQESEMRHRFLFEHNPLPMLIYERATLQMLAVNEAFLKNYGYGNDEALALHLTDLYPDDQKEKIAALVPQLHGHANAGEWLHRRREGTFITNLVFSHDLEYQGCLARMAVMTDIGERKRAEAALRESEQKYRDLVQQANSIILRWNSAGRIMFLNEFGLQFFGYTAEEIFSRHVIGTIVPDSETSGRDLRRLMAEVLTDPQAFEQNVNENIRRNGERVWIAWSNRIVRDEQGAVIEIFSVGTDITARKLAEVTVQRERDFSDTALNSLPGVFYCYDQDLRFRRWNKNFERVTGYTAAEMAGLSPLDLFGAADKSALAAKIREVFETGAAEVEADFITKDGTRIPYFFTGRSVEIDGRRHLVGVGSDITARKLAEKQIRCLHEDLQRHAAELEQRVADRTAELVQARDRAETADRTKSAFLATMSHELRTPLNSIIGFTGIILQGLAGPLNAEQSKQLEMVRNSARHLLALINDVLDISKIEAGQIEIAPATFDLREAIEKVTNLVAPLAGKKSLPLLRQLAPGVAQITSDRRRVEQILLNLLSNSIKFTARGSVTLAAESAAGTIRIAVTDTGIGIRAEDLNKLFQPFRQLDTGLTRQHEGTGLGLAISKRLVERLGGTISVTSQWGAGSTFQFTLPVSLQPERKS